MRKLIIILLLSLPLFLQAQHAYHISVYSEAIFPLSRAYLEIEGRKDTVSAEGNALSFSGKATYLEPAYLYVDFKGNGKFDQRYVVLSAGGKTELIVKDPFGRNEVVIAGNALSVEYELKLRKPVTIANEQVKGANRAYGMAVKIQSPDTLGLKFKYQAAVDVCFGIAQEYIRSNPGSPLAIVAIRMLGKGNDSYPQSIKEFYPVDTKTLDTLFLSIDLVIRNSPDGKKYAGDLRQWK